jgi:hypothetical protein
MTDSERVQEIVACHRDRRPGGSITADAMDALLQPGGRGSDRKL